jgi:hypothetical protein
MGDVREGSQEVHDLGGLTFLVKQTTQSHFTKQKIGLELNYVFAFIAQSSSTASTCSRDMCH